MDILCCDASRTWMAFDQTLLTTTLVFAPSNDLFLKQMICFGRDCFVFTVNDIFFYRDEFQMVVSDFIFAMMINFVV